MVEYGSWKIGVTRNDVSSVCKRRGINDRGYNMEAAWAQLVGMSNKQRNPRAALLPDMLCGQCCTVCNLPQEEPHLQD